MRSKRARLMILILLMLLLTTRLPVLCRSSDRPQWKRIFRRSGRLPNHFAGIHALASRGGETIVALRQVLEELVESSGKEYIPLCDDPRFKDLGRRMNFPQ